MVEFHRYKGRNRNLVDPCIAPARRLNLAPVWKDSSPNGTGEVPALRESLQDKQARPTQTGLLMHTILDR